MQESDYLEDQVLGAFVDDQLDAGNRASIIKAMDNDPELRERVYQLRRAKDLMKLGFSEASSPSGSNRKTRIPILNRYFARIAASVAALAVSFGAGTLGHHYYSEQTGGNSTPVLASTTQVQTDRVILHISESDPDQFAVALAYTEKFLEQHEAQGGQIAVVANAGGLDLMRAGVSPLEKQVIALLLEHGNVQFIACADGIRALHKQGIKPAFIEAVDTHQPAIEQIVSRVQEGWEYIKVDSLSEI